MLPVIPVLEIYKDKVLIYSTTLLYSNVKVRYSFIHSSELTPWTEIWLINSSGIYVTEMYWRGLGAGHPSSPFDLDSRIILLNDSIGAFDIQRYLGKTVVIDLAYTINSSINVNGKPLPTEGSKVVFKVTHLSLLKIFINVLS